MRVRSIGGLGVGLLMALAGCQGHKEDFREIRDGQRMIMAKLGDLEKKLEQVMARAAAGRGQADPNRVYNLPVGNSAFKGPADAPVVMVEFSDFQCPYCAKVPALVDEVLKAYPKEVKFVYKQLPLTSIHPLALNASKAAL